MKSNLRLNPEIRQNTIQFISEPTLESPELGDSIMIVHLLPQSWISLKRPSSFLTKVENVCRVLQDEKSGKLYVNLLLIKVLNACHDIKDLPDLVIMNIKYDGDEYIGLTEAMMLFKKFHVWVMATMLVDDPEEVV